MSELEDLTKCYLTVTGNTDEVQRFVNNQYSKYVEDDVLTFDNELPLEGDNDDPYELWGCEDAEDAQLDNGITVNWLLDDSQGQMEYIFYTRTEAPLNWLEHVATKYQMLRFNMTYSNEFSADGGMVEYIGGFQNALDVPSDRVIYEEVYGKGSWERRHKILDEEGDTERCEE